MNTKKTPSSSFLFLYFLLFYFFISFKNTQAATLTVCTANCDYTTIQAAINAASDNDTIEVASGTYNEAILITKNILLKGEDKETTIIDGNALSTNQVVKINNITQEMELKNFTIKNAPLKNTSRFPLTISLCNNDAIIKITNNKIIGFGPDAGNKDWGLCASNSTGKIIIKSNDFLHINGNAILLEKWKGEAEVSYNNFAVNDYSSAPAIYSMSYKSGDDLGTVDGLQWYHHNHIYPSVPNYGITGAIMLASAYGTSYGERTDGLYKKVVIENNIIDDITPYWSSGRGIQLEIDGPNGGFEAVNISNNQVSAIFPLFEPEHRSRGIRLIGDFNEATIEANLMTDLYHGIQLKSTFNQTSLYPQNTTIENNFFIDNFSPMIADGDKTINAKKNWWGSNTDAEISSQMNDNINYKPWWHDLEMTALTIDSEETLLEVINDYQDVNTAIISKNLTLTQPLILDRPFTLDLNEKEITSLGIEIKADNITIKNGKITTLAGKGIKTTPDINTAILVQNNSYLTLDNIDLSYQDNKILQGIYTQTNSTGIQILNSNLDIHHSGGDNNSLHQAYGGYFQGGAVIAINNSFNSTQFQMTHGLTLKANAYLHDSQSLKNNIFSTNLIGLQASTLETNIHAADLGFFLSNNNFADQLSDPDHAQIKISQTTYPQIITRNTSEKQIVLDDSSQQTNITVPNQTQTSHLDLSNFVTSGSGIVPPLTIQAQNINSVKVEIPATNVTGDNNWSGTIQTPQNVQITLPPETGQTKTLSTAITLGHAQGTLSFQKAIKITFPAESHKRVGFARAGERFKEISTICAHNNQSWADTLPSNGECKLDDGDDLIVWTKHLTTFATYSQLGVIFDDQVAAHNLTWNIKNLSPEMTTVELKGKFLANNPIYNTRLSLTLPTLEKTYTQEIITDLTQDTHFTFEIPIADFTAGYGRHTFIGPQKFTITNLDTSEETQMDLNLNFHFPIYNYNHKAQGIGYFIHSNDIRLNKQP